MLNNDSDNNLSIMDKLEDLTRLQLHTEPSSGLRVVLLNHYYDIFILLGMLSIYEW